MFRILFTVVFLSLFFTSYSQSRVLPTVIQGTLGCVGPSSQFTFNLDQHKMWISDRGAHRGREVELIMVLRRDCDTCYDLAAQPYDDVPEVNPEEHLLILKLRKVGDKIRLKLSAYPDFGTPEKFICYEIR